MAKEIIRRSTKSDNDKKMVLRLSVAIGDVKEFGKGDLVKGENILKSEMQAKLEAFIKEKTVN